MNLGRIISGIMLVLLGFAFLFKELGVIHFSVWHGLSIFWPLFIILIGLAVVFRMRWLGVAVIVIAIAVCASLFTEFSTTSRFLEQKTYSNALNSEGITEIALNVDYGAGKMIIGSGSTKNAIFYNLTTTGDKEPTIRTKKEGTGLNVDIERNFGFMMPTKETDLWDIRISPEIIADIKLNYGAGDMDFDFTNLKVKNLEISCGATKNTLKFADYPTKAKIDAGASSFELKFPKGRGVMLTTDTGASDFKLDGFKKEGENYYSEGYGKDKENIEIDIHAGATSISAGFY